MKYTSYTRSYGILENYLAKKRASVAKELIGEQAKRDRILDIGCGAFPHFLMSIDFKEKHGIDFAIKPQCFSNSKVILNKLNIETEKLPYSNECFDVVVMLAVFEHISPPNIKHVMNQVHRVLKKNGFFIMTTPANWAVPVLWFLSKSKFISKVEVEDHKNILNYKEIVDILVKTGFEKNNVKKGFFELFMNIWFLVRKT